MEYHIWSDLCGLHITHEGREELRPLAQRFTAFLVCRTGNPQVINTTGFPDCKPVTQSYRSRHHSLKLQPYLPKRLNCPCKGSTLLSIHYKSTLRYLAICLVIQMQSLIVSCIYVSLCIIMNP